MVIHSGRGHITGGSGNRRSPWKGVSVSLSHHLTTPPCWGGSIWSAARWINSPCEFSFGEFRWKAFCSSLWHADYQTHGCCCQLSNFLSCHSNALTEQAHFNPSASLSVSVAFWQLKTCCAWTGSTFTFQPSFKVPPAGKPCGWIVAQSSLDANCSIDWGRTGRITLCPLGHQNLENFCIRSCTSSTSAPRWY